MHSGEFVRCIVVQLSIENGIFEMVCAIEFDREVVFEIAELHGQFSHCLPGTAIHLSVYEMVLLDFQKLEMWSAAIIGFQFQRDKE